MHPYEVEQLVPRGHRLQFRASMLIMLLVGVAVGLSNFIVVQMVKGQLGKEVASKTLMTGQRLAVDLRSAMCTNDDLNILKTLRAFSDDYHIAFISVEDPTHQQLTRVVQAQSVWNTYRDRCIQQVNNSNDQQYKSNIGLSQPLKLKVKDAPESYVVRLPIFEQPAKQSLTGGTHNSTSELLGFVVVARIDPITRTTMESMLATAILVTTLVCLGSIPITVFMMRKLTCPLRRLARASTLFASGQRPSEIEIQRPDEIGILIGSFNQMIARLATAHDSLQNANETLEHQVAERTQELTTVNTLLERELETKNEFLRTISHDLSAPLRNIAGMVQMIKRRHGANLPDEVQERINRIDANVSLESSMLDDLMDVIRLGTDEGNTESVNLSILMQTIIDSLNHEIAEANIDVTIQPELPTINVEPGLVRQVFLNLIDNAVKYMGGGDKREIHITYKSNTDWLIITVSDTGIGIRPEDRRRVFQLFRRGAIPQSTNKSNKLQTPPGRGIGLPSVVQIVERWGGRILLESEQDQGSSFSVYLPVAKITAQSTQSLEPIVNTN